MFRYQLVACDRATGAITIPKARALKRYQRNETRKDNFPSLLFPEEYQDEPSYFWRNALFGRRLRAGQRVQRQRFLRLAWWWLRLCCPLMLRANLRL